MTKQIQVNAAKEIYGASAVEIREAFHAGNNAGRGFEWESPEEQDERYELVGWVDAGTDREIEVYSELGGKLYGVGNVNGPWAVRLEI